MKSLRKKKEEALQAREQDPSSRPQPDAEQNGGASVHASAMSDFPGAGILSSSAPITRFDYHPDETILSDSDYLLGKSGPQNELDFAGQDILEQALKEYRSSDRLLEQHAEKESFVSADDLGLGEGSGREYVVENPGFDNIGAPEELLVALENVGYICLPFIAAQVSLLAQTPINSVRSMMLEGPSGCGKSYLAKSLARITGAELMTLQCHTGMELKHLIEYPSDIASLRALHGESNSSERLVKLGIISRAFLRSQEAPVILLVDEIDKSDVAIDTFFLGPIQDGVIHSESRGTIEANMQNLMIVFTKNMERPLNDALLRRVHPIEMHYMDATLEKKILAPFCAPQLVENLVKIGNTMRYSDEAYPFERAPAPEELLRVGKYVTNLLRWNITDFSFIGKNIWYMLSKSEHDRKVLEALLRSHPDFYDPLVPDGRKATRNQIFARLGRAVLDKVVRDPDAARRGKGYTPERVGLTDIGTPEDVGRKLSEVGYQCLPFVATQLSLILGTPTDKVRSLLLEGPSGCGKSFLAKCLSKISGAELMCLSCYEDMNTQWLIEYPSEVAIAGGKVSGKHVRKEDLVQLGILARAFLKSQSQPTILLVDEIDKVGAHIDTFFLGPLQDGRIWLESRPPIDCNLDNLLVIFTKNMNRSLDQALLRRLHPILMTYLDSTLERRILAKHCAPQLVANLVSIADRMRESNGSYEFERPPAPEELLTAGHYISRLLEWGETDFSFIGKNVWNILSKSEHDRAVLDHMLRFHPDFEDPLCLDARNASQSDIEARLGRWVLKGIVEDPQAEKRERAWADMSN